MKVLKVCPLYINYDVPLEYIISQGCYSFVNEHISKRTFPSKESGSRNVDIQIVDFDYNTKSVLAKVKLEMSQSGLRAITLKELVSLGNNYPNLQDEIENWLGNVQVLSLDQGLKGGLFSSAVYVPFLKEGPKRNELGLVWVDHDNPSAYCYAGIKI